jgi:acyl-CoA synthetase (AMP-forming)/AMP-acid ligase II
LAELPLRQLKGYHRLPEATAEVFAGGWFHTGDLGYVQDGFVFIVDRKMELVIRGGYNVYPSPAAWHVDRSRTDRPPVGRRGLKEIGGPPDVIVVGVDGSEASKAALRWAAAQAGRTGAAVQAVTAWEYGWGVPSEHRTSPPSRGARSAVPCARFSVTTRRWRYVRR